MGVADELHAMARQVTEAIVYWNQSGLVDSLSEDDLASAVAPNGLPFVQSANRAPAILNWEESGSVVVTADPTLCTLLACTPTGPVSLDDALSPYGFHATVFDPPLPVCELVPGHGDRLARWMILGNPGGLTVGAQDFRDMFEEKFLFGIAFTDDMFFGCGGLDAIVGSLSNAEYGSPWRVVIGLSRLIKSHTSAREEAPLIEIQDRGIVKPKGKGLSRGHRSIHIRRLFIVDQSVAEACRAALRGGPRAPCLRHLVRGHWRNQACGAGRKERNLMWIQPHWRGAMRGVLQPVEVRVS